MLIRQLRILFLLCLFLTKPAFAAFVSLSDLPSEIQACHISGSCFVSQRSAVDIPGLNASPAMSAYTLIRGSEQKYMLQYNLVPPSGDSLAIPYTGSVWLEVAQSYNLSSSVPMISIFLDTVSPQPVNLLFGDSTGLDMGIQSSAQGLLTGSLLQSSGCCNFPSETGNMTLLGDMGGSALLPCLADGCSSTASLNLLYLQYADIGGQAVLNFNANDNRGLLFQVRTDDPYNEFSPVRTQSYYVSAVPVPASLWLLLSGLLSLCGIARRK